MRIYVHDSDGTNINIRIPTGLFLNRLTAFILVKILHTLPGMPDVHLTGEQTYALIKVLKRYKWTHPGWKLVEVHSAEGDVVEIRL